MKTGMLMLYGELAELKRVVEASGGFYALEEVEAHAPQKELLAAIEVVAQAMKRRVAA